METPASRLLGLITAHDSKTNKAIEEDLAAAESVAFKGFRPNPNTPGSGSVKQYGRCQKQPHMKRPRQVDNLHPVTFNVNSLHRSRFEGAFLSTCLARENFSPNKPNEPNEPYPTLNVSGRLIGVIGELNDSEHLFPIQSMSDNVVSRSQSRSIFDLSGDFDTAQ